MMSVQEKNVFTLTSGAQFLGVGGRWVGDWAAADFSTTTSDISGKQKPQIASG